MIFDLVFLVAGIGLLVWGAIGVLDPELSWRINGRTGLRPEMPDGRISPDWAKQSRNFGWFGIVVGLLNITLSVARFL